VGQDPFLSLFHSVVPIGVNGIRRVKSIVDSVQGGSKDSIIGHNSIYLPFRERLGAMLYVHILLTPYTEVPTKHVSPEELELTDAMTQTVIKGFQNPLQAFLNRLEFITRHQNPPCSTSRCVDRDNVGLVNSEHAGVDDVEDGVRRYLSRVQDANVS